MSKPTKKERINGQFFEWLFWKEDSTFRVDGRSNNIKLGRYNLSSTTRPEAHDELKELDLRKAIEHGLADRSLLLDPKPRAIPLEVGIRLYLKAINTKATLEDNSPATEKRYRAVFEKFVPFCRERQITSCDQIRQGLLEDYCVALKMGKLKIFKPNGKRQGRPVRCYAPRTIAFEAMVIKQFVLFLIKAKHLNESHRIEMTVKKIAGTDTYCYRPAEIAAILAHCNTDKLAWLGRILATLTYTGMRISELISLRWSDIDLDARFIRLTDERHSATQNRRQNRVRKLKGKRSRQFPVHPDLLPVLQSIPRNDTSQVFSGPKGGKLKSDTVLRTLVRDVITPLAARFPKKPGEVSGFAEGRIHSFRHYFCSACANAKVPEPALMQWLGHADSKMVRHYYHLHDEESRQTMNQVDFLPKKSAPPDVPEIK